MRSSTARSSSSWCSSCSFFDRSSRRLRCSSSYSCNHFLFASSMSLPSLEEVVVVGGGVVVVVVGAAVVVVTTVVVVSVGAIYAWVVVVAVMVVVVRVVNVVIVTVVVGGIVGVVATHTKVMLLITITPDGPSTMSSVSPSLNGIFTVFEKVYGPATSFSAPFRKTLTLLVSFPQELPKSSVSTPVPCKVSEIVPPPFLLQPQ
mmetsp:Transcript_6761/g.18251  ORF Transcript_6761/g.18251 Transcript_6761/m.18251 type:complete len:203 (+) Transcript_6761:1578-2186(+)